MTTKKAKAEQQEVVRTWKGFEKDMTCRGYQYEVGKTYEHEGSVEACSSGFHACEDPLHVLRYYKPSKSVFAETEQSGQISRHEDDSKVASSRITIKASIGLPGLIKAAIEYRTSRAKPEGPVSTKANGLATASGYSGAATASGYYGAATASGDSGAATASGYSGAATASGYSGAATASGNYGAATASGNSGAATASGYSGAATASGYYGAATASGNSGAATASGYYGAATASGDSGAATASGYSGAATASGNSGAATASGNSGAATASGYYGAATASGRNGKAMGKDGCALFLAERDIKRKIVAVWAGIVGQDGIKADTWYTLRGGKPQEV